jgi:hypothetical protein
MNTILNTTALSQDWDNGYDCGYAYGHRKAIEECGDLMREQEERIADLSRRLTEMTLKFLRAKSSIHATV